MSSGTSRHALTLRPRALLLLFAAAALLALGVIARSPAAFLAAVPLLLAPAAAGLQAPSTTPVVRLLWSAQGSGSEVSVSGKLEVPPPLRASDLAVSFYSAEPLAARGAPLVGPTDGGLTVQAKYRAAFPCLAWVPLPHVRWTDPLDLLEHPVTVEGSALHIERFPPEISRLGVVRLRRTTLLPGETRSRRLGTSGEFFGLRPALPSDPARRINWRATARIGRTMANEFYLERTGDLLIVLDVRPTSLGAETDETLLAIARAGALGIATAFLAQKARVGLATFGEFATTVPLARGKIQRLRIARTLEATAIAPQAGPPERLAIGLRRFFPAGVTTLLISSLAGEESELVLPHLRRRGFPVFVLTPSPLPLLLEGGQGTTTAASTAARLLTLMRRRRIAAVWREAPVIDWTDYWSLAPLLNYLTSPLRNPRAA
ncbi:MAG: DUF58 domain-containing protein [Thermoplasmata archaeon]|nr:DUF58 domain-containing protein [Thermoplasmata archaeon]